LFKRDQIRTALGQTVPNQSLFEIWEVCNKVRRAFRDQTLREEDTWIYFELSDS